METGAVVGVVVGGALLFYFKQTANNGHRHVRASLFCFVIVKIESGEGTSFKRGYREGLES